MLPTSAGEQAGESRRTDEELFVAACACADKPEVHRLLDRTPDLLKKLSDRQLRQLPNLAAQGNLPAVQTMVESGWPIETLGGDWNATALNLAVFYGNSTMAELLLKHGASWQTKHGFADNVMGTLSYASMSGGMEDPHWGDYIGCAKALIAHGMPLPPEKYQFSDEVTEYFEGLRAV
ncbi:MAG: hypothetical protein JOY54_06915 [Acidobacteriaceae bacterium]|nr:hypothetical protein [Acidobacteriaceae bacterium]